MTAADLARVVTVLQCDGYNDEYICQLDGDDGECVFVYAGDDLFTAVGDMVQTWAREDVAEASYTVWKRG